MVFKSSLAPSAVTPPAPAPAGIEGALAPDPVRSAELEARGPAAVEAAGAAAHVQSLRTMNAVRTLAPILAAAVAGGGDDREQAARFARLLAQSTELATQTLQALGYAPEAERNRWMINVLERGFAEVVATGVEIGASLPALLAQALPERASDMLGTQELGPDAAMAAALVQGLLPVIAAQQQFDFFRNRDADLPALRELLLDEVAKTMEVLLPPMTGASERRTMLALLCQEGGRALADAWLREAERAREALSRKTRVEVSAWRNANPQGFPIDTVHARFREAMHRIRVLAKPASTR